MATDYEEEHSNEQSREEEFPDNQPFDKVQWKSKRKKMFDLEYNDVFELGAFYQGDPEDNSYKDHVAHATWERQMACCLHPHSNF